MAGKQQKKSKKWLEAVKRANRARRGTHNSPSLTRSEKMQLLWAGKYGKKMRKERKQRFKNPEYRKKMRQNLWDNPEATAKHSEAMKQLWSSEDFHSVMLRVRKKQGASAAFKRAVGTAMKKVWADPEYKKKMSVIRKVQLSSEQAKRNMSAAIEAKWENPEYRKKVMATRRKTMYNADWRAKVSAAIKLGFAKGREPWNKGLTKVTNETLMQMSVAQKGRIPDYNKYRCWYPSDKKKKIRMRSGWEVGFALYLDSKGVEWQYEPKYFKLDRWGTYTPDFYIPEKKCWIEIKGRMSDVDRQKLDEFLKRYSKEKLYVISSVWLKKRGIVDCYGCATFKKAA